VESPDRWPLAGLTLKALDPEALAAFYSRFGFNTLAASAESATLGVGDEPMLTLRRLEGGAARPPRTAGLYHFAILLPSEAALGSFVIHAAAQRFSYVGGADHLVSQALYFEDPEGNGIEVYADRPREEWKVSEGRIRMATLPLDLNRLAGLATSEFGGFPAGTVLGHMHLNVGDLDRSQAHYEALGMQLMAEMPSARFLSWDGYHHHLGINIWQGRDVPPVDPAVAGLESFTIRRPSVEAVGPDPDGVLVGPAEPAREAV
jgi:catechol 2,3-dioxygenase